MARPEYVTVQLTTNAREQIRNRQLTYSAAAGRRLNMSETVELALALADNHIEELPSVLPLLKGTDA